MSSHVQHLRPITNKYLNISQIFTSKSQISFKAQTATPPSGQECRDISSACVTAKELCEKGFLKSTIRRWCKKTCGTCEESADPLPTPPAPTSSTTFVTQNPLGNLITSSTT